MGSHRAGLLFSIRLTAAVALVTSAVILASTSLPAVTLKDGSVARFGGVFPGQSEATNGLRSWADYEAQDFRQLELARKVTARLASEVAWLQDREIAAGVPAEELAGLRDEVGRDVGLAAVLKTRNAFGEVDSELRGVALASALQPIADLRALIADSRRVGVDDSVLAGPAAQADSAEALLPTIEDPLELWPVVAVLSAPSSEVARQKAQREADLAARVEAVQQATNYYNSLAGLRQRGYDSVTEARNEAAWTAFLGRPALGASVAQLEAAAPTLETVDRPALEAAVRRVQDLAAVVHQQFITRLPHKVILISLAAEQLSAYQDGNLVIQTLVTTGRPELPTDIGLMRVYRKNAPWLMRSLWPPSSPYWYPDLTVKYAMWFHPSGEAIHDSWWRGWYGPGSNLGGYGSHGCIGLPYGPIDQLYAWTPVDTPVVVIPGDGSPVSSQLARRTYNDPLMARLYGV